VYLALVCAGGARADAAPTLDLEWFAPPDCPDKADVISRVEQSLRGAAAGHLIATADVKRAQGSYRAQLRTTSSQGVGERRLEHADCEILADSVALVIALSAASSGKRVDGGGQGAGLALSLSAHATAVSGPLPRVALGAGGALAVEGLWSLRVELSGTYYAQQSARFAGTNVGGDFTLLRLGLRGCRVWSLGAVDLAPCLGAQLYRIDGMGVGGVSHAGGEAYMAGPAAGVFGRLWLRRGFAIQLAAEVFTPVARRRFVYSDLGPLHRPDVFAFQVFIAPEVSF